ncbi:MAG: hypothetical protein QOF83_4155 [Solirubrobacteraceae bacterium]|jgi:hypothetical protein|nr:hypothetical protein [Solirubrobacteraceae bacterium]
MDGAWLARMRWRRRGAWLWPTFVAATALDALIVHALPFLGDSQSLAGGTVAGLLFNLLVVLLLSRPLGAVLRRRRTDMPATVARNYGGTVAVLVVPVLLMALGLAHHRAIEDQRRMLDDAIIRAIAYIGDRAPDAFRANVRHTDTYTIQPGSVYRTCVPNAAGTRTYCVIVNTHMPLARSVVFGGYESNSLFAQGT